MTDEQQVEAGQIWRDWDSRYRDHSVGRTLKVLKVEGEHAIVQPLTDVGGQPVGLAKEKRIKLKRFRPTSTGYKLVEQEPDHSQTLEELGEDPIRHDGLGQRVSERRLRRAQQEVVRLEQVAERRRRKGDSERTRKAEARLHEARKVVVFLGGAS